LRSYFPEKIGHGKLIHYDSPSIMEDLKFATIVGKSFSQVKGLPEWMFPKIVGFPPK